jgi:type II secretory pathway pseudopilin PulG
MEVLLALALFVGAAAVTTTALNAALESVERQKLGLHALNLASSTLAGLQLGHRPLVAQSPRPCDAPFQDWSWELAVSQLEAESAEAATGSQVRAEVIIRHSTRPIVQRLTQILPVRATTNTTANASTAP